MKKTDKIVLVLEKSSSNLQVAKDGDDVILEGIFAQFGVVNNNARIYEEVEYLPHMEYLSKKISENRLLGELDHPEKFDVSLSKVSHIIEKLEYLKDKRQIVGRVKILDTPSGRIAKELVESGVPISISSRAAGLVESNKQVKIKKIFTYDLVADPGFENAVLNKINESLGYADDGNLAIYDVTKEYQNSNIFGEEIVPVTETVEASTETKQKNKDKMEYVTSDEMNKYSLVLKEEIEKLHSKINSITESKEVVETNDHSEKLEALTESFNKMKGYVDYLSKAVDDEITDKANLSEKIEKVVSYSNYVAKTLDESIQYQNYLAEKTDKGIQYGEYLKEQLEKNIDYSEYLKECLENNVSYSEYIAEQTDSALQKIDMVNENAASLDEKLKDAISYTDYLAENLNKGISYSEYVAEQTQHLADYAEYMLNEDKVSNKETTSTSISESLETETNYDTLSSKVDDILESIKKQKVDDTLQTLEASKKQKVASSVNENSQRKADNDLNKLFENNSVQEVSEKWLTEAPEEFKTLWESLDNSVKMTVASQSKMYNLETPYQIKNFWQTRKLTSSVQNIVLNESEKALKESKQLGYSETYMNNISSALDKFKK